MQSMHKCVTLCVLFEAIINKDYISGRGGRVRKLTKQLKNDFKCCNKIYAGLKK
jgi:hypothetical protein